MDTPARAQDGLEARGAAATQSGRPDPAVSIIVPCRNEAGAIEVFLCNLLDQESLSGGREVEILIADGRSDDGTRAIIEEVAAGDHRVILIDNPGRIVSTGLNTAIRAARGEIIIRMDAHTEYAPDYVQQCVDTLERTGAENVGGPARTRAEGRLQRAIAATYHSAFSVGGARFHDPDYEGELDTVTYGCWRKATLLRLGLFDEELVRNQDDELNLRLRRSGGRIWQSSRIRSWYRPRSSLVALFKQYFQYGYWKVRVIQKHRRPASIRHLVPVLFTLGVAFGWLAGFLHPWLWLAYIGALGSYLVLNLIFSAVTAAQSGWDLFPLLPVVFLTYHLSYGAGFALGIVDFMISRRGERAAMSALTRPTIPDERTTGSKTGPSGSW